MPPRPVNAVNHFWPTLDLDGRLRVRRMYRNLRETWDSREARSKTVWFLAGAAWQAHRG